MAARSGKLVASRMSPSGSKDFCKIVKSATDYLHETIYTNLKPIFLKVRYERSGRNINGLSPLSLECSCSSGFSICESE